MERNSRKVYVGVVVSSVNDKTITVKVETHRKHPLYGKRVQYTKKFTAHDEQSHMLVIKLKSWNAVHYQQQRDTA